MRVLTLQPHRDHQDHTRQIGEEYDTEPGRADEMHAAGFVRVLDKALTDGFRGWDETGGRILTPWPVETHYRASPMLPDDLRALSLTLYDPGSAAYRYHAAFNTAPGLRSAFARYGHSSPFCDLRQYDGDREAGSVGALFATAHVVHVHMTYDSLDNGTRRWPDPKKQLLVRHYHGSDAVDKTAPRFMENAIDREIGALQVGARLYHNRYSDAIQWLPIPMPVMDYAMLRAKHFVPIEQREKKTFRLAHSPTHWRVKGTVALQTICADLDREGVPIELIMIRDMKHGDALVKKATCDATFDSFWLGIQGSGLEAAAMGQPVIAGDKDVVQDYANIGLRVPYTYVEDSEALKVTLRKLVEDRAFYAEEAARVGEYVATWHDYPSVGCRYRKIVTEALKARGLLHAAA